MVLHSVISSIGGKNLIIIIILKNDCFCVDANLADESIIKLVDNKCRFKALYCRIAMIFCYSLQKISINQLKLCTKVLLLQQNGFGKKLF